MVDRRSRCPLSSDSNSPSPDTHHCDIQSSHTEAPPRQSDGAEGKEPDDGVVEQVAEVRRVGGVEGGLESEEDSGWRSSRRPVQLVKL